RLHDTDTATMEAASKWIEQAHGRLYVLVNNTGVALEWGVEPTALPVQQLRDTFETNVFGVVAVTNAMLPLLRRAPAARIVNMSSSLGSLARASDPSSDQYWVPLLAYNASKAALNRITLQYAAALRDTSIKVNAA